MASPDATGTPLSPEDLGFWWSDQPRQRTTMAMLMRLDRRPDPARLRAAMARAVEQVPRLRQRVVDAPFDLALPRWQEDPTFDLDFHLRRYALASPVAGEDERGALFRTVGPIYERPFDRTRPLWELIEIDTGEEAALFFRLHHAVADGVGGNAILAALTDADRGGEPVPPELDETPGGWRDEAFGARLARALGDRLREDADRAGAVLGALWRAAREPGRVVQAGQLLASLAEDARHPSESPLRRFGRARHLTGLEVPFAPLREAREALGGRTIDLLLTAVAGAMGRWHAAQGEGRVRELLTLVPINLRPRTEQGLDAGTGNRATGIQVRLPIAIQDPRARFAEIHRRVAERMAHPAAQWFPQVAGVLAALPRPLYRTAVWAASQGVDLIVTNVPGVPIPRYVAGAEIVGAYPFAPVAPHSPVSIALYGYCGRLFVGIDADAVAMPDALTFRDTLEAAFAELVTAAGRPEAPAKRRRGAGGRARRS
jgi:WS/DGAT/MGAT family acyltransferase